MTVSPTRGGKAAESPNGGDAVVKRGTGGIGITIPAPRHSLGGAGSSSSATATLQLSPVRRSGEKRQREDDGEETAGGGEHRHRIGQGPAGQGIFGLARRPGWWSDPPLEVIFRGHRCSKM